jgi:hypothetical protein
MVNRVYVQDKNKQHFFENRDIFLISRSTLPFQLTLKTYTFNRRQDSDCYFCITTWQESAL